MRRLLRDILVLFLLVGLPLIFCFTYTGPFQWLAELQLSTMGSYYEKVTLVGTMLVWMAACAAGAWIVGKARGRPFDFSAVSHERQQEIVGRTWQALVLAAPIVLLAIAGYLEYLHQSVTAVSNVDIADLVAGKGIPSRYVSIHHAQVLPELDHAITEDGSGKNTTHYLPLLPENYQVGQPVHAFLEMPEKNGDDPPAIPVVISGLASFTGMPGMVRVGFARDNLPPAGGYVLLRYGMTPAQYHSDAIAFAVGAAVVLFLAVFSLAQRWWLARRAARRQAVKDHQWGSPV